MHKMEEKVTPANVQTLNKDEIFVFGSNLEGFHTSGAARAAIKWGAIMGKGTGKYGNTYAIPTTFQTATEIKPYVSEFIQFAESHPEYTFLVTEIGCGHAGYEPKDIAPFFREAVNLKNIYLPYRFLEIINQSFAKRLNSIINYYSIPPLQFINSLEIEPAYIMKLVLGSEYPTVDVIQKILIKYPEVNARWLLLGEGNLSESRK